ncbi:acyltransferase family protein [Pseudonocardia spinosispora]|uniref:acyltransferase family protein n=1 Tax=Pseudonocardia spinosispora TaxID=103441 RepID=UPI000424009E|nr:acyltransferase [Pseudonocardia spinosispora]
MSSQQCVEPAPASTRSARPRLHSLTGLRYFAALAVVGVHVGSEFAGSDTIAVATGYGYVGVTFFFLLSGFVLTWSYSAQPVARFWWLRFSRTWPLNMTLMAVWFTVVVERAHLPGPVHQAAAVLMIQAWDPRRSVYFVGNFVSWSLSCEMFFYLMFPFAIMLIRRLDRRGLLVAALSTTSVMVLAPWSLSGVVTAERFRWLFYIFPPYRFGEFLLGMIVARAVLLGLRVPWARWGGVGAGFGLALLTALVTWSTVATGDTVSRPLVALLAIPFLILLLASSVTADMGTGRRWLARTPLVRLGEWSFALYLVHEPLFQVTQRWGWWGNGAVTDLTIFLLCATGLAAVLHYGVERPAERLLRRVAPRSQVAP